VAYRADIEIAVRGASQITNLQQQLISTASAADRVSAVLGNRGVLVNSVQNLSRVASQANTALRSAAAGTTAQKQAIDVYVKSLAAAEKAEINLTAAIKQRQKELGIAQTTAARGTGGGGRIGGAVSGAIIGGAFPLLFGQGGGAAAGGAIGGLVGGLAGPGGSFAGSLLGTLIGDIASKAGQIKELGQELGFSAQQTELLSQAAQKAGRDFDQFQAAVQNIRGVGLSLDDQASTIQLVTTLTDKYGGSINAVANAFTSALESGKVSQSTLNQLTSQGIPIQDELAKKYGVTRDELLKLAKDGKISVQDLADELVNLGNQTDTVGTKSASAFDKLVSALGETGKAIGSIVARLAQQLSPVLDAILNQATQVINRINQALAAGSIGEPQKQGFKRQAEQVVTQQAGFLPGGPFGAGQISVAFKGKTFKGQASSVVSQITNQLINEAVASQVKTVVAPPIPRITAPSQLAPAGGAAGGASRKTTGKSDAERLAEELQKSLVLGDKLGTQFSRQVQLLFESSELEQKRLEIQFDFEDRQAQINELKNAEQRTNLTAINGEIKRLEILKLQEEVLKQQAEEAARLFKEALTGTQFEVSTGGSITDFVAESAVALQELTSPLNRVQIAAESIGTSFSNSFKSIVTGTQSAQEAISQFFANVGQSLIDYATTAIAQYVAIGIARLFAGLNPFNAASQNLSGTGALATSIPGLNVGGAIPFAEGGFVTGPTNAVIGEGGQPEYVIPASKMSAAMTRYAAGNRGASVIPGSSEQGGSTALAAAPMEPIDVRYSVERINNVDYVTTDQFQRGLAQAAQQGAIQGERRALRTLGNSPANRRRIGL